MSQHDYTIDDQSGLSFLTDLDSSLAAIVSKNSGATEPTTTYAYMWWADTTSGLLKIRNAADSAWVTLGTLADANLGLIPLSAVGSVVQAYDANIPTVVASQAEMEAGTETANRTMNPAGVKQAIDALGTPPTKVQDIFTSSGTFDVPAGVSSVDVIIIAPGGGGGGGGAGNVGTAEAGDPGTEGLRGDSNFFTQAVTPSGTVTVTIGEGGAGGAGATSTDGNGTAGSAGGTTTFDATSVTGGLGVNGGNGGTNQVVSSGSTGANGADGIDLDGYGPGGDGSDGSAGTNALPADDAVGKGAGGGAGGGGGASGSSYNGGDGGDGADGICIVMY